MVKTEIPYTYVVEYRGKKGLVRYWRFRRNGVHTKLPGKPSDSAFHAEYARLMALAEDKPAAPINDRSFAWLCREYLASAEYGHLSERTQADYRQVIDNHLVPAMGPERFDCITRAAVKMVRDAVGRDKPRTGHKVKQITSLIYSWADQNDLVTEGFNPAANLKKLKYRSEPITIWSEEEITLFMAKATEPARTIAMLALYTGQRRTDIARMEWKQVQGDFIRVRQNKTGEMLDIPCHPELKKHLATIRTNFGGPILRGDKGKPMSENGVSMALRRAVAAIPDMPDRTIHGFRYAAAGALEATGCTVEEIMSIIGHRTYQMARKYFSQRRNAEAANRKLAGA